MAASQCHSPHWYICGGAPCLDDLNHEILLVIRGRYSGTIPRMGSANERRCYIATPSLIGRTYTQNYPWILIGLRTELNNSQPTILFITKALHINAQTMCKSWWPMHMLMTNEFSNIIYLSREVKDMPEYSITTMGHLLTYRDNRWCSIGVVLLMNGMHSDAGDRQLHQEQGAVVIRCCHSTARV